MLIRLLKQLKKGAGHAMEEPLKLNSPLENMIYSPAVMQALGSHINN